MCEQPCEVVVISETTRGSLRIYATSRSQVHSALASLLLIIERSCHAATISPLGTTSHPITNPTTLHHLRHLIPPRRSAEPGRETRLESSQRSHKACAFFLFLIGRIRHFFSFSRHESFHLLCNRQAATFALQQVSG
jgi:hypothetical protein